jgi:hypothetical protein
VTLDDLGEWTRESRLRSVLGWKKGWIFARLADGSLRGVKLRGLLMIEVQSVRQLLASAEPYPRKAGGTR